MKFVIIVIFVLLQNLTFAQCLPINTYQNNEDIGLPDGSIYHGKVKNNKFNDVQGFLNWTNGAAYVGGFKDGLMSGIGKIKFANKSEYKGQFENGLIHGYGIMNFVNGNRYEGYFKNDLFDGIGNLKYDNLGGGYYGSFKNDTYHGKGTLYFDFGDVISFKGNFINGKPKTGILTLANGDIYNGKVDNELFPHGEGEYVFKNKKFKKGLFEHGVFIKNN
ncbi:MAG: hypothetical protein FE834_05340 [Gammaproteobacteria bacterium]|nr:hypothetical protein [Gammaproteobacteria bacterium]